MAQTAETAPETGTAGVDQHRVYRLERRPFDTLDGWLEPSRRQWTHHLDALARHLDDEERT